MRMAGQRVLVVGLGASGLAAVKYCAALGADVSVTDNRTAEEIGKGARIAGDAGARLYLGSHPKELFSSQDVVIPSPGVRWDLPMLEAARAAGATVAGELHWAAESLAGPTVAITGTNGKTTTTALVGHIFEHAGVPAQVGGNIGTPVLDLVSSSREGQWNVLELSSFQLEAAERFPAEIAAVLNVTPDHLDRHGTLANYAAMKERVVSARAPGGHAVLNARDPLCRAMGARATAPVTWFGPDGVARAEDGAIYYGDTHVRSGDLPIRGPHNLENALAAVAICALAAVPLPVIGGALGTFRAVPHRLEHVRTWRGVEFYNDSKATNVDAALKAITSFSGDLWVILGGSDKGSEFTSLADPLRTRARAALLIGASSERIAADLGNAVAVEQIATLKEALAYAAERAEPGDTVLLAPACASFDQFQNYQHRGDEFRRMVGELKE